jgi:RimJ/RimL family protein N-acetyltransferase
MIQTERLSLIPLTAEELDKYKWFMNEREMDCINSYMDGTPFRTLWVLIHEFKFVGEMMFYGDPDESGEIEIGCRTREPYRNLKFMSEAIGGVITWAQTLGVKSIKAKIDSNNYASIRMCEKNGFEKVDYNIWKIKL